MRHASRARARRRRVPRTTTAAAWATLPSGKTGTNSAIASPRRGERSVASAAATARRIDQAGRPERKQRRSDHDGDGSEARGNEALLERERTAAAPSVSRPACAAGPGSSDPGEAT